MKVISIGMQYFKILSLTALVDYIIVVETTKEAFWLKELIELDINEIVILLHSNS